MRKVIGTILFVIDLLIGISGAICLVMGMFLESGTMLSETLLLIGWIGMGTGIGTGLCVFSVYSMLIELWRVNSERE